MGNSEVGHMNLGAGRVIHQDFTRISQSIDDGEFFDNAALSQGNGQDEPNQGKALHLFGLLSKGGVHSHEEHIKAAVDMARSGRHLPGVPARLSGWPGRPAPICARTSIESMQAHILEREAMEASHRSSAGITPWIRDNRWERVQPAYELIVNGTATRTASTTPQKHCRLPMTGTSQMNSSRPRPFCARTQRIQMDSMAIAVISHEFPGRSGAPAHPRLYR